MNTSLHVGSPFGTTPSGTIVLFQIKRNPNLDLTSLPNSMLFLQCFFKNKPSSQLCTRPASWVHPVRHPHRLSPSGGRLTCLLRLHRTPISIRTARTNSRRMYLYGSLEETCDGSSKRRCLMDEERPGSAWELGQKFLLTQGGPLPYIWG